MGDASEQAVADAVRASLGTTAVRIVPTSGGHSRSWYAVADGIPVVVKTSPLVRFEAWAAHTVHEHGVPAAEVLAVEPPATSPFADGHLISVRLAHGPVGSALRPLRGPAIVRRAGATLRRIHQVEGAAFGVPRADLLHQSGEICGVRPTWPLAVEAWLESLLRGIAPEVLDAATADEIRGVVARHAPRLSEQHRSTLLHGDYSLRHLLAPRWRARITGVLDFDGGLFGAPAYDLAVWSIASPTLDALAEGYEPDPTARKALLTEVPLYRLVRFVAELRWAQKAGIDLTLRTEKVRRGLAVLATR